MSEIKIPTQNGTQFLCFEDSESNIEGCTYIRLCDSNGDELVYWHYDEWVESPIEVMGAMMGALTGGAYVYHDENNNVRIEGRY